ncbi:MAG: type II CRISPR-associated endonuclease Cas1 [Bacilli bacterium]|jgi:CRISPR-associated endonuclease Cas1 subtype II|nr:type II CRISPR-associated endonuclease Cas1 [Bacilli bacterium]
MAFRTVIVDSHSKLECSLNYLVFRTVDETKRILLDEVHTLIVQSTAVSITSALLAELSRRNIKVVFCDEKSNPCSELVPCHSNSRCSKKVLEQTRWDQETKDNVWAALVKRKIENQAILLSGKGFTQEGADLVAFSKEVAPGDPTNREGHAAKVYFNRVFYDGFTRDEECPINACLNYGYTIILSQFNRAVVAAGYITQLGIHHKSEFNEFNLSCDLMEPFRYLVDEVAESLKPDSDFKELCVDLLGKEVVINDSRQTLSNAIGIYCDSVFSALQCGKASNVKFLERQ